MLQLTALPEGRTHVVAAGPLRGIQVRARDGDAGPEAPLPLAMVIAGAVGVVVGVLGANPWLLTGWLN